MGDDHATAAWWKAEADGWQRENDRHRDLYVGAVKERDNLRLVVTAAIGTIERAQFRGHACDVCTAIYRSLQDESIAPEPAWSDEDRLLALVRDSNQITDAAQSVIRENLDLRTERDRLRRLVYLIYRSTHDRPIHEIDWLAPWARELLGETIEAVKREVAGHDQLDGSEVMGEPSTDWQAEATRWMKHATYLEGRLRGHGEVAGDPLQRLREMGDEAADRATPSEPSVQRALQRVLDEGDEEGVRRYLGTSGEPSVGDRATCRWCHQPITFTSSSNLSVAGDAWAHEGPQPGSGYTLQRACEADMQSMLAEPEEETTDE